MKLPKLNEALIKKILEHIKKFPDSYDQNGVISSHEKTKDVPCGAVGCFGGWAVLLSMPKSKRQERAKMQQSSDTTLNEARDLCGFTQAEANLVFAGADGGDPEIDLSIVKSRIDAVRQARKMIGQRRL